MMFRQHIVVLFLLFTAPASAADWDFAWQRLTIGAVTWSADRHCASVNLTDENLRLGATAKAAGIYSGSYVASLQRLLVYAEVPACASAFGDLRPTLLSRELGGSLTGAADLPITLMFGDCRGPRCPPESVTKHRLRLDAASLYTDPLLTGGMTTAPFREQSGRALELARAIKEAAAALDAVRQIDCRAMAGLFTATTRPPEVLDAWREGCERSATAIGRPEVRRIIGEYFLYADESALGAPTVLRMAGIDTKAGLRFMEFVILVRDGSTWRLAFIGWV
jgi:hypothetical protein